MADPKPMCYYIMNNGCIEEQKATFERPDLGMKNHLKPLFIRAKVEGVGINKVLIDGGAAVNLMPLSMLPKIGKYDYDLSAHNIVLSNYEGKTGYSRGQFKWMLLWANIAPCYDRENAFKPSDNVIHSVKLHSTQGFIWEREEIYAASSEDGVIPPSGWNIYEDYYD
ncbi:hypothetical protein QL285_009513 [Trifolium repens]|nr:hypothetical protein QL285_009513 [Trifolium repens]